MVIPDNHPRAKSLHERHKLIEGLHNNILTEAGLIAHGRGEAFDYLLHEQTHRFAEKAIKAAASQLILAKHPIISVNGNTAILIPEDMVRIANKHKIPLEINLFYRKEGRVEAIKNHLLTFGLDPNLLFGCDNSQYIEIQEISHLRRIVDRRGISIADVVVVPLEDGDRTQGLKKLNKKVITVDLNPLSRTSQTADITIVDNITRVFTLLEKELDLITRDEALEYLKKYDNQVILQESLRQIRQFNEKN
ncbi:MAG: phosphopantothenate/pantothenate synthetase [Candidatus Heimdallarchaeota archaeon]|nr:phosphopantothenate/pantothenate synthetase [Candidatus Heimdallarchaeota archaeon]